MSVPFVFSGVGYRLDERLHPVCAGAFHRVGNVSVLVERKCRRVVSEVFLYLKYTAEVAASCQDRDLSENSMVIGTSAIIDTEIDGAVGMNSGIFNNSFIIWGRYKKKWFRYYLTLSYQFHHTQMDGAHAGAFLKNLQNEIDLLK